MCTRIIIKLSAAVHQLSCTQTFLPYFAMVKNRKIRSCDLDVWPMTLKFSAVSAVVKIHFRVKFRRAKCSGSWVIVVTEKKNSDENNTVRRYRADSNYYYYWSQYKPMSRESLLKRCSSNISDSVSAWLAINSPTHREHAESGYVHIDTSTSPSPGLRLQVVCHSYKIHPHECSVHRT